MPYNLPELLLVGAAQNLVLGETSGTNKCYWNEPDVFTHLSDIVGTW